MWILGDSIAYWAAQAFDQEWQHMHRYPSLARINIKFHGVRGLKMAWIPALLEEKLTQGMTPRLVIIHCGTNDIMVNTNLNAMGQQFSGILEKVFIMAKSAQPPFKVVWSDILPKFHYNSMKISQGLVFTNNANAAAQFCCFIMGHAFQSHLYFDGSKAKFYRVQSNGKVDPVHLIHLGYQVWFHSLDAMVLRELPPKSLLDVKA